MLPTWKTRLRCLSSPSLTFPSLLPLCLALIAAPLQFRSARIAVCPTHPIFFSVACRGWTPVCPLSSFGIMTIRRSYVVALWDWPTLKHHASERRDTNDSFTKGSLNLHNLCTRSANAPHCPAYMLPPMASILDSMIHYLACTSPNAVYVWPPPPRLPGLGRRSVLLWLGCLVTADTAPCHEFAWWSGSGEAYQTQRMIFA